MTKTAQIAFAAAILLITITTSVLLLPAQGAESLQAWWRVPLPILFGALTCHQALRAYRRGEHSTTNSLLVSGVLAAGVMFALGG